MYSGFCRLCIPLTEQKCCLIFWRFLFNFCSVWALRVQVWHDACRFEWADLRNWRIDDLKNNSFKIVRMLFCVFEWLHFSLDLWISDPIVFQIKSGTIEEHSNFDGEVDACRIRIALKGELGKFHTYKPCYSATPTSHYCHWQTSTNCN